MPGRQLIMGDVVVCGPAGGATIRFADGSRVALRDNTRVSMDVLEAYDKTGMVATRILLERGRVSTDVEPAAGPGSKFEIETPSALTAVRGTNYRVAADEDATSRAEVLEGEVVVAAANVARAVPRGFGTVARQGSSPSQPEQLLPPPDLASPEPLDRLPLALQLEPVPGAVGYRVLVSADPDFATLLADRLATGPVLQLPDLEDGSYHVIVRALAESGLEGLDRRTVLVVDARPEPPLPLGPVKEGRVRDPRPTFTWAAPMDAAAYHFELADNPAMERPLMAVRTDEPSIVADRDLPVGRYYWRVATEAADGERGPFGDVQQFDRLDPPPVAEPEVAASDSKALVVTAREGLPGQTYQFQLATDPDFETIVADRTETEPRFEVRHPSAGTYYLRTRVIDTDGYAGAFGVPQKIDITPERYWPIFVIPLLIGLLALL